MNRIFLIFIFLISIKAFPNNENEYILNSNVNLRQLPSKSSEVLKVINKDEIVNVDSLGVEWCKVKTNDNLNGYVNKIYLLKKDEIKEDIFANINWKKEIIYFFIKIILAFLFNYLCLIFLLKKEKETVYQNEYDNFLKINKFVYPLLLVIICFAISSWLIYFVFLFDNIMRGIETESYKHTTKSGKADRRFTKNQAVSIDRSRFMDIANRSLNILYIYLVVRIIIYIVRYFI